MDIELMRGLANNGPWAAVAGFLLWKVIQAWAADRAMMMSLMTEFRGAIVANTNAVTKLTEHIDAK